MMARLATRKIAARKKDKDFLSNPIKLFFTFGTNITETKETKMKNIANLDHILKISCLTNKKIPKIIINDKENNKINTPIELNSLKLKINDDIITNDKIAVLIFLLCLFIFLKKLLFYSTTRILFKIKINFSATFSEMRNFSGEFFLLKIFISC